MKVELYSDLYEALLPATSCHDITLDELVDLLIREGLLRVADEIGGKSRKQAIACAAASLCQDCRED